MKHKSVFLLLLVFVLASILPACKKGDTPVQSPADVATAETSASEVGDIANAVKFVRNFNPPEVDSIDFVPETEPMPDWDEWVARANAGDLAGEFVVHVMYRDKWKELVGYQAGYPVDFRLNDHQMHIEKMRWIYRSNRYFLTHLVQEPIFILKPFSSGDQRFWNDSLNHDFSDEVIEWLEEAAKRGYGHAEYLLGLIYWNGLQVEQDKEKATSMIVRAAHHNVAQAQFLLAMMHELGIQREENHENALYWLLKAEQNASPEARFVLSMKYADGIDFPKDLEASKVLDEKNAAFVWSDIHQNYTGDFDIFCFENFYNDSFEETMAKREDVGHRGHDVDLEEMEMDEEEWEAEHLENRSQSPWDYPPMYSLLGHWLERAAQDVSHDHARLMWVQIAVTDNCHSDVFSQKPDVMDILFQLADHHAPNANYALAQYYQNEIYDDDNGRDDVADTIVSYYQKAIEEKEPRAREYITNLMERDGGTTTLEEYILESIKL